MGCAFGGRESKNLHGEAPLSGLFEIFIKLLGNFNRFLAKKLTSNL